MEWFPKATGFVLQKMACGCSGDINDHILAEEDEHDMFDDVSVLDSRFYEGASRRHDHNDYSYEQQQQQQQHDYEHEQTQQHAPGTKSKSSSRSSQQQQPVYHLSDVGHGLVSHHASPFSIPTSSSCSRKSPVSPVPSYATASTATMQTFEDVDIDDSDHDHDHHSHEDEEEEEEVRSTASTQVISHLLKLQTPSKYSRHPPNVISPNNGDPRNPEIPTSGDAYRVLLRMPPRQPLPPHPSLHSLPRNSNIRPRVRSTPARHNQRDLGDLPPLPTMAL
jgi:hypothetical protein